MAVFGRLGGLVKLGNKCFSPQITSSLTSKLTSTENIGQLLHYRGLKTRLPWTRVPNTYQVEIPDVSEQEEKQSCEILRRINDHLTSTVSNRLFAIVHICGKQFRVVENDIIIVQGYWPPNPGDELRLEKVLLVASTDFTLVGRPILGRELAYVDATVIEKTFSQTKIFYRYKKRKQYHRTHLNRTQHTMLRINAINVHTPIDQKKEVEGLDRIY